MSTIEKTTVRRIPLVKAITVEDIARDLFNELQAEKKYEIAKTRDVNNFLFDVKKLQSSFLKLAPFHCELKLYEQDGSCVCECVNKDTESQLVKYAKSFLIGGGICILNTKNKMNEIQEFPDKIERMIKTIIANQ